MKVTGIMINLMEKDYINGQMADHILELGRMERCMVKVSLCGLMEEHTMENIKMI